jgi:hypothetical protein
MSNVPKSVLTTEALNFERGPEFGTVWSSLTFSRLRKNKRFRKQGGSTDRSQESQVGETKLHEMQALIRVTSCGFVDRLLTSIVLFSAPARERSTQSIQRRSRTSSAGFLLTPRLLVLPPRLLLAHVSREQSERPVGPTENHFASHARADRDNAAGYGFRRCRSRNQAGRFERAE